MKKILLILAAIISILLLLIFLIAKVEQNHPTEITYDGRPYKMKAESTQVPQKTNNQSIYDEIFLEKKPIIIENIVSGAENPVLFDQASSNIDKIINHLINDADLQEYKGIKIFVSGQTLEEPVLAAKKVQQDLRYTLDLGFYHTQKQALDKQSAMEKLVPKSKEFLYTVTESHFSPELILFHLKLTNIGDFNTAKSICEKFNKYKESCVITNLD